MVDINTQVENIEFQLKNLVIQFENIKVMQMQKMQIQSFPYIGLQMLNMGIQILNIGIENPTMGYQIPNIKEELICIITKIQNIGMKVDMNNQMPMNMMMPNQNQISSNNMINNDIIGNIPQNVMANNMNIINDNKLSLNLNYQSQRYAIQISPEKTVKELINAFKNRSGFDKEFALIYNSSKLNKDLKISEYEIKDKSFIEVIETDGIIG